MLSLKSAVLNGILLLQLTTAVVGYESLGCWGDANTRAMPFRWTAGGAKGTMTVNACVDTCIDEGYAYAGTQYGDHCFCGNTYDMYGQKDNCNMDCKGGAPGNGDCGGSWANEIWATGVAPPPPPPPPAYESLGCWGDANTRAMPFRWTAGGAKGTMTVNACVDTCIDEGYAYAGTQYGDHCFCGNKYDKYGQKNNCDMDCKGSAPGNGNCGGSWANEIWVTGVEPPPVPEGYVGCYKDNAARDMDFEVPGSGEPGMTVQKCLDGCKQFGYKYAGAQYGGHCFCGNEYGSLGTSSDCDMDCEGECGGSWANSVYASGGDGNIRFGRTEGGSECIATGWGDPHIITFDGLKYDVHVQSEMTFLKSKNTDFTIQARLEPVPIGAKPMVTTAIVVKEADATLPKIQVSLAKSPDSENAVFIRNDCYVQLFVDDVSRDVTSGTGREDAHVFNYGRLIKVEYPTTNLQLDIEVGYWRGACYFSIDFILMDCRPGDDLIGILGSPDGDKSNDWMDKTGAPLPIPSGSSAFFFEPAYDYAIENWCISDEAESHFTYEPGYGFSDYENCLEVYNPALEEIVTAAQNNPDSDGLTVCEPFDFGCIIETETLGTEAGEAYLKDPAVVATQAETIETPEFEDVEEPTDTEEGDEPEGEDVNPTDTEEIAEAEGDEPEGEDVNPTDTEEIAEAEGDTTPPPDAGSRGDPHFKTWKNEHFEYHSQCDLVLNRNSAFADGLGLDVQIRTKLVRFWSYIRSAAIRIGDDILEIQGTGDETNTLRYWHNFVYQSEVKTIGGFPITLKKGNGRFMKNRFIIDLDSKYPGQKIQITTWKEFVAVDFKNPSIEAYGKSVGMLGDFETGRTLARDGRILNDFHEFGDEWQVRPTDDMLFHDVAKPQFPTKCMMPEDPQGERRRRLDESSVTEEQAEAACASLTDPLDRKDCIYDILATQDTTMAGAY